MQPRLLACAFVCLLACCGVRGDPPDCDPGRSGSSCQCSHDLTNQDTSDPVILFTSEPPQVGVDSEFVDDQLILRLREATKYYDSAEDWVGACKLTDADGDFVAADGVTKVATAEEAGSVFNATFVEVTDDLNNCYRLWTLVADFNKVYNVNIDNSTELADRRDCGMEVRGADDPAEQFITYYADFRWRNFEVLDEIRNTSITRELVHRLPFELKFPKIDDVTTSAAITIFSPVRLLAALTESRTTIDFLEIPTGYGKLITEVQFPFLLKDVRLSNESVPGQFGAFPNGVTTGDFVPRLLDGTSLCPYVDVRLSNESVPGQFGAFPNGVTTGDFVPRLLDGTSLCPYVDNTTACSNTWEISYTTNPFQSPYNCEFDGVYALDFTVTCHDEVIEDCPVDTDDDTITVQITIDSSSHCSTVITDIQLTSSLFSYASDESYALTNQKDDFLHNQTAYFRANLVSNNVALHSTEFEDVSLIVDPGDDQVVYSLLLNTVRGPDADTFEFQSAADTREVAANQFSHPTFQFLVDTEAFGFGNDEIRIVVIDASIKIIYANSGEAQEQKILADGTVEAPKTTSKRMRLRGMLNKRGGSGGTEQGFSFAPLETRLERQQAPLGKFFSVSNIPPPPPEEIAERAKVLGMYDVTAYMLGAFIILLLLVVLKRFMGSRTLDKQAEEARKQQIRDLCEQHAVWEVIQWDMQEAWQDKRDWERRKAIGDIEPQDAEPHATDAETNDAVQHHPAKTAEAAPQYTTTPIVEMTEYTRDGDELDDEDEADHGLARGQSSAALLAAEETAEDGVVFEMVHDDVDEEVA